MNVSLGERTEIDAQGTKIAVRSWGHGTPVLCLHATGHDSEDFAAFAARTEDRFRVVALDWPAQGHSPPDRHKPRATHYAEIAHTAALALKLDRPILLGNSIGGAAAILAAASHPDTFRGVVLCNPGGLAPINGLARFAIGRMVAFFEAGARGAKWYPHAFRFYYTRMVLPRTPAKARREAIIARGLELAPLLAEAWRGFAEPEADLRETARTLALPVWCAWAKSDRLVSWGRSKAAVKAIPGARWQLFRGGHAAFMEDPDRFAKAFVKFAQTIERKIK